VGGQIFGYGVADDGARTPAFGSGERIQLLVLHGRQPDLPDPGMLPRNGVRIDARPTSERLVQLARTAGGLLQQRPAMRRRSGAAVHRSTGDPAQVHLMLGPVGRGLIVLLTSHPCSHLEAAHDLSGWDTTRLDEDHVLVQARDLGPWYAEPRRGNQLVHGDVIEQARRDFGDMLLTPQRARDLGLGTKPDFQTHTIPEV